MDVRKRSSFGRLHFEEPETVRKPARNEPGRNITVIRTRGLWHPPDRIARFLPSGYSFPIDCHQGPDGVRRFVVGCSLENFIDAGAVAGLAVLRSVKPCDEATDHTYRTMHLVLQHVRGRRQRGRRGMKEHLTRRFASAEDLYIRHPGRSSGDERSVLPDNVGHTADGRGFRWSINELMCRGRSAALEAGDVNPTEEDVIHRGLLEAARLDPLVVESDRVLNLVRLALFNIDSLVGQPSAELIEQVYERLVVIIHQRLDVGLDHFDERFFANDGSLVRQIAQQKNQPGGVLKREDVRQALLHLCWQAYQYVGQCLHAFMRTIKHAIRDPLSEQERRLFEHAFEAQPYYGGLPLALLAERIPQLRHAILSIWEEPEDEEHVRVLHRLLEYYAVMASARRRADNRSKKVSSRARPQTVFEPAGGRSGQTTLSGDVFDVPLDGNVASQNDDAGLGTDGAIEMSLVENLHSRRSSREDQLVELAKQIREQLGVECDQGCVVWDSNATVESDGSVRLEYSCQCDRPPRLFRMAQEDFVAMARRFVDLND